MQRDFLQIVLDDQLRSLFRVLNFQKLKVIPELKMCVVVVDGISPNSSRIIATFFIETPKGAKYIMRSLKAFVSP